MIPGCGHEEAMVDCVSCAVWWCEQPGECEGRAHCNEDNHWRRCDLTRVDDYDDRVRELCPECLKARRRAIAWEGRGDDLRDMAKDSAVPR